MEFKIIPQGKQNYKQMKKLFFIAVIGLILTVVSCNKSETPSKDLIPQIVGTYNGSFTDNSGLSINGKAQIAAVNDSVVQIHCFDEDDFDTTFVMEFYGNGDSVMLCNTGSDFFEKYGHQIIGEHHMWNGNPNHMMGNMSDDDWQQHLSKNHDSVDEHYGAFDMINHNFNYLFKNSNNSHWRVFSGKREN